MIQVIEVRRNWHMSSHSYNPCGRIATLLPALLAFLCSVGALATAQEQPTPKWELFGGYSFIYPNADVHGVLPGGILPVSSAMESNPKGIGTSLTYNFSRWFGLTADASGHWGSGESGLNDRIDDAEFYNFSVGPKVTFRGSHFSPFLEALVGDHRLEPEKFHDIDRLGLMFGGGIDVGIAHHVALRLLQADYVLSSYRYGPSSTTPNTNLRAVRLQAGVVFTWGGERNEQPPAQAACTVQPSEVFAGEAVVVTAQGSNFDSKRPIRYSWSGSGVRTGETGASTQIDTGGLRPGPYQITASLSDGTTAGAASCNASFNVKTPRPPVISCAADPTSVPMGGTSNIRTNASSPDGRRLTYSYTTSSGNISGTTSSATLETAGAQPGTITIICNVSDDRQQPLTASASTTVNLEAPPPPPELAAIERRLAIHSVYFATAKPSLENPDAGLLASQETTLTTLAGDFKIYLQSKPDARLTLEGHADPRGSVEYNQQLSERRVDRTKRFLVGQGVPAANIQTEAFGKQQNLTDAQVKDAVERNPELSKEDRKRVLDNMRTIILASNRRVDITLSNAGQSNQKSVREYPFNAADSLTLLQEKRTRRANEPGPKQREPRPKKKVQTKAQQ
jgi:outer membrane protein OmpA-like peptidoglycan-associated protein